MTPTTAAAPTTHSLKTRGAHRKGAPKLAPPAKNMKGHKVAAPASKGGKKTRASVSTLHVNNHSGLYVEVYVDNDYAGTVGPYGDIYPLVYSGSHSLYAIARYDDGTYDDWGPSSHRVNGTFTWNLYN